MSKLCQFVLVNAAAAFQKRSMLNIWLFT